MAVQNQNPKNSSIGWIFGVISISWLFFVVFLWLGIARKKIEFSFGFDGISDDHWRNFGYFIGTLGVGPIAIYLAAIRTKVLSNQLINDGAKLEIEQTKVENDRTKLVNETFAKSVELLGHKELPIRQGGVYALAKLAKDERLTLHATIMKILTSYVRDRSKEFKNKKNETDLILPIDVETALYSVRDRNSDNDYEINKLSEGAEKNRVGFLFDMSNSYLINANLERFNFSGFNLSDCVFEGCLFSDSKFDYVNLINVDFKDSNVLGASFKNAKINGANLELTSNLIQDQVNEANGNNLTLLPPALSRPKSWV